MSEDEVDDYKDSQKYSEKELRRRRREEKDRKKDKARGVWRDVWGNKESEYEEKFVNTHADNLAACSCDMCVSPRKSNLTKGPSKKTMQEQRFDMFAEMEEDLA